MAKKTKAASKQEKDAPAQDNGADDMAKKTKAASKQEKDAPAQDNGADAFAPLFETPTWLRCCSVVCLCVYIHTRIHTCIHTCPEESADCCAHLVWTLQQLCNAVANVVKVFQCVLMMMSGQEDSEYCSAHLVRFCTIAFIHTYL